MIYIIKINQHSVIDTFDSISDITDAKYKPYLNYISDHKYCLMDSNHVIINNYIRSVSRIDWIEDLIEDYKIGIRDKKIDDILR